MTPEYETLFEDLVYAASEDESVTDPEQDELFPSMGAGGDALSGRGLGGDALSGDVRPPVPIRKCPGIHLKDYIEIKDVRDSSRGKRFTAVANSGETDRDGESIEPKGWVVNPHGIPLLFGHNYGQNSQLPLGGITRVRRSETDGLVIDAEMNNNTGYPLSVFAAQMIPKSLRWLSVGFLPKKYKESDGTIVDLEKDDKPGFGARKGRRYLKQELVEVSLVPVPSDPRAVIQVVRSLTFADGRSLLNDPDPVESPQPDTALKPFPNEHACRIRDPGKFEDGSFRRTSRTHEGKRYDVIMGRLKGETTMTEQSYRYPKGAWPSDMARMHCRSHDGAMFEPASGSSRSISVIHDQDTLFLVMASILEHPTLSEETRKQAHEHLVERYAELTTDLIPPELRSYSEFEVSCIRKFGVVPWSAAGRSTGHAGR